MFSPCRHRQEAGAVGEAPAQAQQLLRKRPGWLGFGRERERACRPACAHRVQLRVCACARAPARTGCPAGTERPDLEGAELLPERASGTGSLPSSQEGPGEGTLAGGWGCGLDR